jgi:hypothetical protein
MDNIGKLVKVELRDLWKKEDKHFSKWLESNIDHINELLGISINVEAREKKVGPFRVDLFGSTSYGNIIIENQLEKTNHDHLGKLLTYMTNLPDVKHVIWIAKEYSDEHRNAVDFLNEFLPVDFYLIKLEAVKIEGGDKSAPLFTVLSRPTEQSRAIGKAKVEDAQRHILRREFWSKLLEKMNISSTSLFTNRATSQENWISAGAGRTGISYDFVITNKYARVEIYLNYLDSKLNFEDKQKINKTRYDLLFKNKKHIETIFKDKLVWDKMEDKQASRISYQFDADVRKKGNWNEVQEKLVDRMIRLEKSAKKYISKLD